MDSNFSQLLAHVTGGRRYAFVIMTYHEGYTFFERIRKIVSEETGFDCIRADDIPGAGEDLRSKIHAAIDGAAFVIADVSQPRPNIYYEVGYVAARTRPLLLLAKEDVEIPTDLLGLEMIRYAETKEGILRFEKALRQHLAIHRESNVSLMRAMVMPQNPSPSFIVADPKLRGPSSRFLFHPRERRTWGDYLGIVGVLSAFGSVYGEHIVPELLSASHISEIADENDQPIRWDANFYLVGSPKSNLQTERFLSEMQRGRAPNWRFGRCPGEDDLADFEVQLSGELGPQGFSSECTKGTPDRGSRDCGLVVRGPHPEHSRRMVTILAGPHSLGAGAACIAATNTQLIREIGKRLAGTADLAARDVTIWVLVKGVAAADRHLYPEGVEIVDAGVYED